MNENFLPVESIQERDIDLLLLEEFNTNNVFCEWFINESNFPKLTESIGGWKSISDYGLGETDILFSYKSAKQKIYILIENKLDANFQDKQYERYLKRARKYINDEKSDLAFVILVAPKLYCENQNEFEYYITYEQIAERLNFIGTKRTIFKSNLLTIASEKLRRGYKPVNSKPVQKFWHSYWNYKEQEFPQFYMKKPGIVPQNSDWPMLYNNDLKNIIFYHKLGQGNTDATFVKFPPEVEFKIKEILPKEFQFVKHGKSFSIRIHSGKIDRTKDFEKQKDNVKKGLENLDKIRKWIKDNIKDWLQQFV